MIFLIFAVNLVFALSVDAATINAASCASADVQSAINSAASGDTVAVPSGTCTWSSSVTVPSSKGLIISGAGIGSTVIVDSVATSILIVNVTGGNSLTRITGFSFDGNSQTKSGTSGEIEVNAVADAENSFRIDHNRFYNQVSRIMPISMHGYVLSGVVDHNTIDKATSNSVQGISIFGSEACGSNPLPTDLCMKPFTRAYEPGSSRFIFVEDNTYNYTGTSPDGALDSYSGARWVFRHNTVNGTFFGDHGADSGNMRGVHSFEVYNNTISNSNANIFIPIFLRSGVGVIFHNTITGNYGGSDHTIELSIYRDSGSYAPWGQCDGTSIWDENQTGKSGYACLDQPGHLFTASSGGSNTIQPLYAWKNTKDGAERDTAPDSSTAKNVTDQQANRDYYNYTASFDGSSGVGEGLLSARPATCTPLTAYFATDVGAQGTLYQCATANTWTAYYIPYTYPHPLTTGTLPSPPKNLRIVRKF